MVKIMMLGRVATLRSSSAAFRRRSRAARVEDNPGGKEGGRCDELTQVFLPSISQAIYSVRSVIPSFYPKD